MIPFKTFQAQKLNLLYSGIHSHISGLGILSLRYSVSETFCLSATNDLSWNLESECYLQILVKTIWCVEISGFNVNLGVCMILIYKVYKSPKTVFFYFNLYHTVSTFHNPEKEKFLKIYREKEKLLVTSISFF